MIYHRVARDRSLSLMIASRDTMLRQLNPEGGLSRDYRGDINYIGNGGVDR